MSEQDNIITAPCGQEMSGPTKEHEWLQQFVGEWTSETEICMDPSQPPMKATGTESTRAVGGFWILAQGVGEMEGMPPFHSVFSLGYDPKKGTYVGSWIDSMTSHLWRYEGCVDDSGRVLTLKTHGPSPGNPDGVAEYREVTEFKSPTHRSFTSSLVGEDGSLTTFVRIDYRRK